MSIIRLGDSEYDGKDLSLEAKICLKMLKDLDARIGENENFLAILNRAKNSYITELKSELYLAKAGLDLSQN